MPSSRPRGSTYRLLVWLDDVGNPLQVAVAKYLDEERLGETTWTPEPFDTLAHVAKQVGDTLDIQLRLL